MTDSPKPTNWNLVWVGVALIVTVGLVFVFAPSLGVRQVVGMAIILLIGLGLTVAGSADKREN
jgi:hypothetical protein